MPTKERRRTLTTVRGRDQPSLNKIPSWPTISRLARQHLQHLHVAAANPAANPAADHMLTLLPEDLKRLGKRDLPVRRPQLIRAGNLLTKTFRLSTSHKTISPTT